MPHPRLSGEEIERRGRELYERTLRAKLETDQNIGRILSIDVETGNYAIGEDPLKTSRQVLARRPEAPIWTLRIGYNAVYAIGGTLTRTVAGYNWK
jgi:hypothetical protein